MSQLIKILIVDDEIEYRETYRMLLESRGYTVTEAPSATQALKILSEEYHPVVMTDVIMPGEDGIYLLKEIKETYGELIEVIVVTGYGSVENAVEAMKSGALGYFIKSRNPDELFSEIDKARRLIRHEVKAAITNRQNEDTLFLEQSKNPIIQNILEDIEALRESECNVLITGESGVGKEIFAKLIHDKSQRSDEIFLPTNCQAFSENLLEAELFGHEKGAFTGASQLRIGRFEEASGGTMFLDEIGELSQSTQVKLLRVLDSRMVERIGSNKAIPVKFRLVSATNQDLDLLIKKGDFREDLFYRINTMHLKIPPLRERREDLEEMIHFFIRRISQETKKKIVTIDPATMQYLLRYDYPGNIRELRNIIERLIVLSKDGVIRQANEQTNRKEFKEQSELLTYRDARRFFEMDYLKDALERHDNNISKTATVIGLSRRQLFNKITEYGLIKK